ncbi:MAG: Vms1/Ankzf1 family peptidyl-tRNA hydrolase [Actinomycetota bacterium]
MTEDHAYDEELRRLLERKGPFVSVYLDTHATTEEGGREIQLRWRALRQRAVSEGAREAELAPLDDLLAGIQRSGWGLATFLAEGELVVRRFLPAEIADGVTYGALPHLVPLLEWRQEHPRFAVVIADRRGAEIHVLGGERSKETISVEGERFATKKIKAGGAAHRRIQQAAEETWEANAREVARELDRLLRTRSVEFVAVTGDVRAEELVEEALSEQARAVLFELERAPATSIEDISTELERDAAAFSAQTTEKLLERFHEGRGQQNLAVEGAHQTLEALRRSQVDTLLLAADAPARRAWFAGADLTQSALEEQALLNIGLEDTGEASLDDVLVRSALGTGAGVRILPSVPEGHGPREGVGAILRYT